MSSDYDDEFQYMIDVENGWVHGLEYDPDQGEYTAEDLKEENTAPEVMLSSTYPEPEYDQQFDKFHDLSLEVDEVKLDTTMGIVDVFKNGDLQERYSLVGILENENNDYEIVFGGLNHSDEAVYPQSDSSIDWSTEMSAAYQAITNIVDLPDTRKEGETNPLRKKDDQDNEDNGVSTMGRADTRSLVSAIDEFIKDLDNDPAVGIADFENKGEVLITGDDHYGDERGYRAALNLKKDMNRLQGEGLLDYDIENLNDNGDSKRVDFRIEREFLDGNDSLRSDVDGLSDFDVSEHDGREELIEERF